MTTLILIVTTILVATAIAAGYLLSRRLTGPSGGWTAARRCRQEAALAVRLEKHAIDRAAYRDAMSALAAADDDRFPLEIPKQPQD